MENNSSDRSIMKSKPMIQNVKSNNQTGSNGLAAVRIKVEATSEVDSSDDEWMYDLSPTVERNYQRTQSYPSHRVFRSSPDVGHQIVKSDERRIKLHGSSILSLIRGRKNTIHDRFRKPVENSYLSFAVHKNLLNFWIFCLISCGLWNWTRFWWWWWWW